MGARSCERPDSCHSRKRITSGDERAFLIALSRLHIDIEEAGSAVSIIRNCVAAAIRYGLTAYVDLASREKLAFATLDVSMRKAAEQSGVIIFRQL